MGRRNAAEEVQFGNDSFLDVITNMVGIMIILIVIAGLKVSKAPVVPRGLWSAAGQGTGTNSPTDVAGEHLAAAENVPSSTTATPPAESKRVAGATPDTSAAQVIKPSPQLKRSARELESELAKFDAEQRRVRDELRKAAEKEDEILDRRKQVIRLLAIETNRLEKSKHDLGRIRGTLDQTQATLTSLKLAVEMSENEKPPVEEIRHKLNPVSRIVEGKEFHFQLSENRVAPIPIEDLIERTRPQIQQQQKRLLKDGFYVGQAGPVAGFLLNFRAETQPLSVVDEIRLGGGKTRAGLAQWEIVPEPDILTESAEDALHIGSKFLEAVRSAPPNATLTFWVYPDSFELYRRLTRFAHDEGFTVAARPLPYGVPISGSPRGSKSAGQ